MASTKTADLCVASGHYTDVSGKDRNQYENIGVVMRNEKGESYLILKPYINLSGFPQKGNGVIVSIFRKNNASGAHYDIF